MCGGSIISDFIQPSRSSRRLTAELLWGSGADLIGTQKNKKKNPTNYYSKPLRSGIVDFDDEFEADFQDFKDHSDDEIVELEDVKPFAFSSAELSGNRVSSRGDFSLIYFNFPLKKLLLAFWLIVIHKLSLMCDL